MKRTALLFALIISIITINAQDLYHARQDGNVDSVYYGLDSIGPYTGAGVIIGVTDWGFDYTHPVFYDTSMTHYRILRAWDQFRTAGPAPEGFDYGTELVGQAQLLAAQCDTSNIYGHHYHGTHVSSIAAGSGAGTAFRGVAPDADLIFCSFRADEQSVIDAFDWMYRVAQEEQKRLVVNMSWGIYWMDNFDGTGPIGQKMQELSDLGVVFVTSGGNNGDEQFHIGHTFANDTIHTRFFFPADNRSPYYWGSSISMTNSPGAPFSARFSLRDRNYEVLQATPFYNSANGDLYEEGFLVEGGDTIFYNMEVIQHDESGRPDMRLRVKQTNNSAWRFCLDVAGASGDFHAWNLAELTTGVGNWGGSFKRITLPNWINGDCQYGTGTPANVDCAITVAAHQSRYLNDTTWMGGNICSFSSYGPTISGRDKPDISAPGFNVISAMSSFADEHLSLVNSFEYEGRTYGFCSLSGTSMSSPFTAGVVALLLQANPTLTPHEVKLALIYSATHDEFTEASGMVRFGHGKVNARQAILRALYHVGSQEFENHQNQYTVYPNPANDVLFVSTPNMDPADVTIYDMNGRMLYHTRLTQGVNQINMSGYPVGYYLLQIVNGTYRQTEEIIKTK